MSESFDLAGGIQSQGHFYDEEMPASASSSLPPAEGEDISVPSTPIDSCSLPSSSSAAHSHQHRSESSQKSSSSDSVAQVLQFLRKNGLQEAERSLLKEISSKGISISEDHTPGSSQASSGSQGKASAADLQNLLPSHQSENDPGAYLKDYESLIDLVENCLDRVKPELNALLYPVFAHMYLELICNNHVSAAEEFLKKFGECQETYWKEDVKTLSRITTRCQIENNELLDAFRSQQYVLRLSKECVNILKPLFLQHPLITQIMKKYMKLESSDGAPRSKEAMDTMIGGLLGEASKAANKSRIMYGILREPEVGGGGGEGGEEGKDSKKKKIKGKDGGREKGKKDPNAPPFNRISLPELSDKIKGERKTASKEYSKRIKLSPDHLPSICLYTFLNANAHAGVCCCDMSEDSSLLVAGYGNSGVQVFSLLPDKKIKPLKKLQELEILDKEMEDVAVQMLDEEGGKGSVRLYGHSGPVYGVSLSPDSRTVLSSSEDSTVRLWSLETWTNLVVYRVGGYPIWDVSFCPRGYYFASGGADRMALLWSTDKLQPFRIFAGHSSDVNCVKFHPNCNYLLTGCDDRSVRVFDISNGQCVRVLNGHKGGVHSVQWSPDGRYIASGGSDGGVILWDVGQGRMIGASNNNPDVSGSKMVNTLAFSRDSNVLAAGGMDNAVRLFHLPSLSAESKNTESAGSSVEPKLNVAGFEMGCFRTKSTPLLHLHFTRRNLLIGVGSFDQ